ncbi:MAG TPA: metallophosphoesterase [Allosphingosinicella sp.]
MARIAHLSDVHFGCQDDKVVDGATAWLQEQQPDLVIISGDFTQRARVEQFKQASTWLNKLRSAGWPVLAVPGNHDIPLYDVATRLLAPYRGFVRTFGESLEPEFDSADLLVCCINTTRWWRHADGEISAEQIERAAARFRAARPEQLRIAVVHQPMAVIDPADVENLLNGAASAARAWADAGCDLVLGGHIHLPYVVPLVARHAPMSREVWAVQAGTAVSSRVREGKPNSVNVIRHTAGAPCRIEQWDHDAARKAFVRIETTDLKPTRPGPTPSPAPPSSP